MKLNDILLEAINFDITFDKFKTVIEKRKETDHSASDFKTDEILQQIISSDPTPNQKYVLKWILPRYLSGEIRFLEDMPRVKAALDIFDKNKQRMEIKDVQQIKSLSVLEDMVEPFLNAKSKNEIKDGVKSEIYKETKFLHRGPEGIILIPLTQKSSCFWGKGTRWCTASTSSNYQFNRYNRIGPLYIIILPDGRKYQFHFETNSFMNDKDYGIDQDIFFKKNNWVLSVLNNNWSDDDINRLIKHSVRNIKFVLNPSEELILHAVKKSGCYDILDVMSNIKNPSEEIQLLAIKRNMDVIQHIKSPSETVQKKAVTHRSTMIQYIKKPTETVQKIAVTKNPSAIQYIKKPSTNILKLAVSKGFPLSELDIDEIPEEIQKNCNYAGWL